MKFRSRVMWVNAGCAMLALLSPAAVMAAADGAVDLLATPAELTSSVAPNVVLTFDDSGSMAFEYMPDQRPYDGAGWGQTSPIGTSTARPWFCAGTLDHRQTGLDNARSRPMNGMYYNPNVTYVPPTLKDGITSMPNASYSGAWNDGIVRNRPNAPNTGVATTNLSSTRFCNLNGGGYYRLKESVALALDTNGRFTAASLTNIYTASNWEAVSLPTSQQQNFANWFSYYSDRRMAAISAMSRAFAPFDKNIRVAWQNLHTSLLSDNSTTGFGARQAIYKFEDDSTNANVRTRFYDWLFQIPANSGTPNIAATNRVGEFFKRAGGAVDSNPYWDRDLNRELSCRQNFHINMSDGFWNGGNPAPTAISGQTPSPRYDELAIASLPDDRGYNPAWPEAKLYSNYNAASGTSVRTLADVTFHYWASNLRPDFSNNASTRLKVPPFLPDRNRSLFNQPLPSTGPLDNREIYWNPANDPATWSHMVNFNISFGLDGLLPQLDDTERKLRLGDLAWPYPVVATDDARKLDDFWHAALNSRGRFLSAKNPDELITGLQEIVASIIARRAGATATSVSLPLITDGTVGFSAGFDTADWSGFLTRDRLDIATGNIIGIDWDAGCLLTGGACATTAQTGLTVRNPNTRAILTSDGVPGSSKAFRWGSLSSTQRAALNIRPDTIRLDLGTWTNDTNGERRAGYIRGDRTYETTTPRMRVRSSLLGAVIRGQPVYVSSPVTGHRDTFPEGSPEANAASGPDKKTYAKFQNDQRNRRPTVYVGSNNGMLHAFDAATGFERFAYIPNTLIQNFRLVRSTQFEGGLVPGVDDKPLQYDAFLNNEWRTVLVGSLRLGGRGVYALDITKPLDVTEASSSLAMWEFSNVAPPAGGGVDCQAGARFCSSLGYTYESVNLARIRYQNKWVALISSGYFPTDSLDPASNSAAASRTSLMVVDLQTGTLIREIRTSTAPQFASAAKTFGLSQPIVYDFGSDQIADIAVAGDLAGNLWRFDLSSDTPANWKVDLMFKTYGGGGATNVGDQPISFAPQALRDPTTRGPIFVFGTGKFIGLPDRVSTIPQQNFYGIRDYGSCSQSGAPACSVYPISVSQLVTRQLAQDGNGVRSMPSNTANNAAITTSQRGWRIPLNITSEPGERAGDKAFPFFSSNMVLLRSVIPKGVDPCDPGARYGLFLVEASTGTVRVDPTDTSSAARIVGGVLSSSRPPGDPVSRRGGGKGAISLVGLPPELATQVKDALEAAFAKADDVWHRGAWRDLDVR